MEPTGNYSKLWINTLLDAGKEVRLISNRDLTSYRKLCQWDYKDDYHDATALAYCGWLNINNPSSFLAIRDPEIQATYQLVLEHERINRELKPLVNRARNLLHTEFSEAKNSKSQSSDNVDGIWLFISNSDQEPKKLKYWRKKLSKSIGTANESGFSSQLIKLAQTICSLKERRITIKHRFQDFLLSPEYDFYRKAFSAFDLGIYESVTILCQIYPFEQFLDGEGNELRKIKPRKFGKAGKPVTKRVGLNRFHARLGKAVKPWESGKKKGHIVTGSVLSRIRLYLWAHRFMGMGQPKDPKPSIIFLYHRYLNDIQAKLTKDGKIDPERPGNNSLKQWGKSRVGDKLVKLLFKELIGAYRRSKGR
uniref:IS110 family transposase n=1 Tax=Crocosphaera watsonii TaxID=263511 RepID=UPI0009082BED